MKKYKPAKDVRGDMVAWQCDSELKMFTCRGDRHPMKPKEEHGLPDNNNNAVELNLGLSLNGRFGLESPQRSVTDENNNNIVNNINKLYRASSVTDVKSSLDYPLTRTSSLPPETAVDRQRRKQLQSLRRLEAKRKRVEKLKNGRMVKGKKQDHEQSSFDETMPCVSTKGGKRIRGLLYRYGEDEEVRIVCVCHGWFLTPVEFVKHGGGGEVEHPLRHIVVTSLFS
ncbi:ninja-family protein AFP3-like [Bidens hawaiensis]|uniref:ninja-family protein AFP3-like n=1 Tax=Bidens hawaiensis TaxID=980011 RepID=UPI0040494585